MKRMRVSVLVTFYNQEKYVDRALESILNQKTDFGVKIIVGDDGSSDSTCAKVKKWINLYPDLIELHIMERKSGDFIPGFRASRNRLNLLDYVTTEYFIFLDGDDFYDYEYKLQKQVEILDSKSNQDCIACCHNIDKLFIDGTRKSMLSFRFKEGKYNSKKYWDKLYFHTDTALIRSEVISTIDKERLINNFNDSMIMFCTIQQGLLYYIPESWTVYLQTGDGIWTSGNIVINQIRNMFLHDFCNQINPNLKKQTSHRFSEAWAFLLKMRKSIEPDELREYVIEAKDKNLIYSSLWLNYKNLNYSEKKRLCFKAFFIGWKNLLLLLLGYYGKK